MPVKDNTENQIINMAKGVAVKALFLVVLIGLILFFFLLEIGIFLQKGIDSITIAQCSSRVASYCDKWRQNPNNPPDDWDGFAPGCRNIGIYEPTSQQCGI